MVIRCINAGAAASAAVVVNVFIVVVVIRSPFKSVDGWLLVRQFLCTFPGIHDLYLRNSDARRCCFSFFFCTRTHTQSFACRCIHSFTHLFRFALSLYSLSIAIHFVSSLLVIRFIALFLLTHRQQAKRRREEKKEYTEHISFPWALRHFTRHTHTHMRSENKRTCML